MRKFDLKSGLIILTLSLIVLITGCSNYNSYQKSIYDNDTKISDQGDSYSFTNRIGNSGEDWASISFTGFYGKQTIWKIEAKEDCSIDIDLKCDITRGKFKVCLINSNKEVSIISENSIEDIIALNVLKGENFIVIIGSNAKGEADMTVKTSEKVILTNTSEM